MRWRLLWRRPARRFSGGQAVPASRFSLMAFLQRQEALSREEWREPVQQHLSTGCLRKNFSKGKVSIFHFPSIFQFPISFHFPFSSFVSSFLPFSFQFPSRFQFPSSFQFPFIFTVSFHFPVSSSFQFPSAPLRTTFSETPCTFLNLPTLVGKLPYLLFTFFFSKI